MIQIKVKDIQLWQANYRVGDVGMIVTSIQRFGYNRSVSLWRDNVVIAGNHTVKALQKLEAQQADTPTNVTLIGGDWAIDVTDVSHLSEGEAQAYAIADNRASDSATNDDEQLASLLTQLQESSPELVEATGFDDVAVSELLNSIMPPSADDAPDAQIDRAEELNETWQVKRGDLWQIGNHRLLCGDSTNEDDVKRLMDGELADLALTDPPYGVKMDKGFGGSRGFNGKGSAISSRQYSDDWDSTRPSKDAFDLIIGASQQAIVFGGNFFADILPQSTHWIVWDKLNTMPTFGDCELAWTNIDRKSVKKITFEYNGLIGKEKERFHPTQKPVGLFLDILNNYTEGNQTIYDPFLGSGTTMVASEQLNRKCYGIEIEEKYCAVILERMSGMGLSPELVSQLGNL